jgi:phytoene dehydrogenase-like protein
MHGHEHWDAIIVGAGHNGLVASALLARAGRRVLVVERSSAPGGAAVSACPFPGVDVRVSRYSYLVSLFPRSLLTELGVDVELRRRSVSSYTPVGDGGVLVSEAGSTLGDESQAFADFYARTESMAGPVFASLTEPLLSEREFRDRVLTGDGCTWEDFFERPISAVLERSFSSDVVRGIVATDALIGTFASLDDPGRIQNRCFLYHVIGNGTGRWDVPVGGMGAVSAALTRAALGAGAVIQTGVQVAKIDADGTSAEVTTDTGDRLRADHVLSGAAPAVLAELLGDPPPDPQPPEGSQLKLNLLLRRLPRLRDRDVDPAQAFAGTFHVNESFEQLQTAYQQAASGQIPELPPCEAYCHSLTDPSILGDELRMAGAQTLTVFGLHMPARLFTGSDEERAAAKDRAVTATLRSIDSVLDEPIEDCLWESTDSQPCLEARTPPELEDELALPAGHIFHRDLAWPFAESEDDVGRWGVETDRANVWLCGAGARRGGGVSGIAGHNAARAVLLADAR